MKTGKRIASVVLMIMMLVTMVLPALGDDASAGTNDDSGKITINNAVVDQSYTIYQILTLESWDETNGAYAYKATTEWNTFVDSTDIKDVYLAVDAQGYVTWIAHNLKCTKAIHTHDEDCGGEGICEIDEHTAHTTECYYTKEEEAARFAKLAKKYADDNTTIITTKTTKKATSTTVEFTDLNLGYYLIDTTLGTLCTLDTTDSEVSVTEKNVAPTIEKKVYEDSNNVSNHRNDADFGQIVKFETKIEAKNGAYGYILHDKMDAGLTFNNDITISDGTYTLVKDADYTVATNSTDGCTFEITFIQDYLDTITTAKTLSVTYSATLNKDAVVGEVGNKNETWLTYGDDKTATVHDITKTYTWDFSVFKYTGENTPLDGAKFVLYKKTTVGEGDSAVTTYYYYKKDATTGTITWVSSTTDKPENIDATKVSSLGITSIDPTGTNCIADINGLDADVYYLHEYVAPNGYNILNDDVKVEIISNEDSTDSTKLMWEVKQNGVKLTKTVEEEPEDGGNPVQKTVNDNVVKVLNQSGTKLPATGGIGTTIFYCAGAALTLGALVLLITKKRMQKQ